MAPVHVPVRPRERVREELKAVYEEVLQEVRLIAFHDFARETLQFVGKLGSPSGTRLFSLLLCPERRGVS